MVSRKRQRPNLLDPQRELTSNLIATSDVKITPTFSVPVENQNALLRRLQKRNVDPHVLFHFANSSDPIFSRVAYSVLKHNPKLIKSFSIAELKSLIATNDFSVRDFAIDALTRKVDLKELSELVYHQHHDVRISSIKALRRFGKKSLPILCELALSDDVGRETRIAAIDSLGTLGKDAYPYLHRFTNSYDWNIGIHVAKALGNVGPIALPDLKTMADKGKTLNVRLAAIKAMGNIGKSAIPLLLEYAGSKERGIYGTALDTLVAIGKDSLPYLIELHQDVNKTSPAVLSAIFKLQQYKKLSSLDKKSIWAKEKKTVLDPENSFRTSPRLLEVMDRMKSVNKISGLLRQKYEKDFIGLVIFGSIAKGYASEYSDVDVAVITPNVSVFKDFKHLAEIANLPLCVSCSFVIDPTQINLFDLNNFAPLFHGIFFGNKDDLRSLQRKVFLQFRNNPQGWDRLREEVHRQESSMGKAYDRLQVGLRERGRVNAAIAMRTLPSYAEMKKILNISDAEEREPTKKSLIKKIAERARNLFK